MRTRRVVGNNNHFVRSIILQANGAFVWEGSNRRLADRGICPWASFLATIPPYAQMRHRVLLRFFFLFLLYWPIALLLVSCAGLIESLAVCVWWFGRPVPFVIVFIRFIYRGAFCRLAASWFVAPRCSRNEIVFGQRLLASQAQIICQIAFVL